MKKIFLSIIIVLLFLNLSAQQDKYEKIKKDLTELAQTYPVLNEKVNISVSDVSIQEFIRAIAKNTNVNINVSPDLDFNVVNNFSDVKVVDLLVFLTKEYDLDIKIIGNIISISKSVPVPKQPVKKEIKIVYFPQDSTLSFDIKNDTLFNVVKAITSKTGRNIIVDSKIKNKLITSYIKKLPVNEALRMLAVANDIQLNETEDKFWIIEPIDKKIKLGKTKQETRNKKTTSYKHKASNTNFEYRILDRNHIDIFAKSVPISDIVKILSDSLNINYYIISEIKGEANLNIKGLSYDDILKNIFDGTESTFNKQNDIYLFGDKTNQELQETKVIPLQYRSVEELSQIIPDGLTKDISIKEFLDLNSLVISGPTQNIEELEQFLLNIDKIVPVILIEVLIVEVSSNYKLSTGISAGLNKDLVPTKTTGTFSPGIDFTFSTSTINNLINSFNGFGLFNIGKVTPEFYLSLKALEDNGYIRFESTPMLSTMNGREATLTIGETTYYSEEKQNTIGTQNPQNIMTKTWKSVQADLAITIKPVVSGNDQVTLDINVTQSDFTGKVANDAPPGTVNRTFKSLVRVKNQEMVLLGGLKTKKKSNTGSGLPWLSRVPVIKWIFSSRTKENSKDKLTIFIKPTVIY